MTDQISPGCSFLSSTTLGITNLYGEGSSKDGDKDSEATGGSKDTPTILWGPNEIFCDGTLRRNASVENKRAQLFWLGPKDLEKKMNVQKDESANIKEELRALRLYKKPTFSIFSPARCYTIKRTASKNAGVRIRCSMYQCILSGNELTFAVVDHVSPESLRSSTKRRRLRFRPSHVRPARSQVTISTLLCPFYRYVWFTM